MRSIGRTRKLCQSPAGNFTLIELLVTIAIIAILASMLLPALSNARQRANEIKCMGNLKQLMFGFTSYADAYGGYSPMIMTSHMGVTTPWARALAIAGALGYRIDSSVSGLVAGEKSLFDLIGCPTPNRTFTFDSGYGMRTNYGEPTGGRPGVCTGTYNTTSFVMGRIREPSQFGMLFDSYLSTTKNQIYRLIAGAAYVHLKHNKKVNVGFCDGSARGLSYQEIYAVEDKISLWWSWPMRAATYYYFGE